MRAMTACLQCLTLFFAITWAAVGMANYLERPEVKQFITDMERDYDYSPEKLRYLFTEADKQNKVIELMDKPAEAKPWYRYRPIFISEQRVTDGVAFWKKHDATLQKVSAKYQVPPEYIVAIIGAETNYGGNTGSFRVFDTLATLAFDYPRREEFFKKELVEFLLMTREEHLDPLSLKGSYAGAMGPPQFMPSSYRAYAADFDDNGQRDLLRNTDDAIASVANYFHQHGWKPGGLVALPAIIIGDKYNELLSKEFKAGTRVQKVGKPEISFQDLKAYGISTAQTVAPTEKVSLIELDAGNGKKEYWITFHNFYVITRYNHSNLYAMVIYDLSQLIKQKMAKT